MGPMKTIMKNWNKTPILPLGLSMILAAGFIAGCSASSEPKLTPAESVSSSTAVAVTSQVVPSATPRSATAAIYVHPEEDSELLGGIAQPILEELAISAGYQIVELEELPLSVVNPNAHIVVLIGAPSAASDLIQNNPEVRFLLIGETDIEPGVNVSTIGSGGLPKHEQSFLAGYIAALIAPEWRTGMMMAETESKDLAGAFQRGIKFYCGLCRQTFPPYYDYPVVEIVKPEETGSITQSFQSLSGFYVDTVYVSEGVITRADGYERGEELSIKVIGSSAPPDAWRSNWVAAIQFDLEVPLRSAWSELIEGSGGNKHPIGFVLTDVNDELLSPGKLDHANDVISEVVAGYIGVE